MDAVHWQIFDSMMVKFIIKYGIHKFFTQIYWYL